MSADTGSVVSRIRATAPATLTSSQYMSMARELAKSDESLQPLRQVFLSTYTTKLFDPFLKVEAARLGFDLSVFHGGFGQFEQVMLADDWQPADDTPVALTIAMRLEDLDPNLAFRFYAPEREAFDSMAENVLQRIVNTVEMFRAKSPGPALVANFAPPRYLPLSVFEANNPDSLSSRIHELNRALIGRLAELGGAFVWDYAGLVAERGASSWTDPRLWSLARTAVAAANQPALASHLMRTIQGVMRPAAKCLVLDLDNTLWGGAVGDDGLAGIVLGDDYPGSAFKQFQRAVLGLRDRGIVLALCSKNDEEVVQEVLADHPEMLIRAGDVAAQRINWRAKSENIREIAAELNIGLDSLVFFDDNPVERAEVRASLPEVAVVEVPADPVMYVDVLFSIADFDVPALTSEDRGRADSYKAQVMRRQSEAQAGSLEDFLGSLDMQVEIGGLDKTSAPRIAQLIAKTNQFNLTTRRRSQAEIEALAAADDSAVYWLRLTDRYGDMGLIAVAVVIRRDDAWYIDSLILSCRAANRGMEQTMLAFIVSNAKAAGQDRLVGEFIPSPRNDVVAGLYASLGFEPAGTSNAGKLFALDLAAKEIEVPDYVKVAIKEAE